MLTDPETVIKKMPPGHAIPARNIIDGGAWETSFYIREESRRISRHTGPEIEIRAAILKEDRVALVPCLVRVGREIQENIFETWLNYYAEGIATMFAELAEQPRIALHFYGDSGTAERHIECVNSWGQFFRDAILTIEDIEAWEMQDFDQAREKTYTKYPTVLMLWNALLYKEV